MTRLSVPSMVGLMMGTWFLGSAGGNAVSAILAQEAAADGAKGGYVSAYWDMGIYAVAFGIFVMLISPLIKKLMHLDTLKDDNEELEDIFGGADVGEAGAAGVRPATRPAE